MKFQAPRQELQGGGIPEEGHRSTISPVLTPREYLNRQYQEQCPGPMCSALGLDL